MGRNKNKYVKEKYNQPGFVYSKSSNSDIKTPIDEFMQSNGFQEEIVYSENKDKRWNMKEELASKITQSEDSGALSVLYEMDPFKPSESTFFVSSEKQPKNTRVNIASMCNMALGRKSKRCQKCTKSNDDKANGQKAKACSMIAFSKEIYSKKGIYCSCCRQSEVNHRIKFRNEKIKAFSECAYDPYFDEVDEITNQEDNGSIAILDGQPKPRPMSIDIETILNEPNNTLRFKPRDPDNGFELINTTVTTKHGDQDPSSDFEYVEDDDVML